MHRWVQRSQAAHKLHTHPTSQREEKAWQAAPKYGLKTPYFGKKNQKKGWPRFCEGKEKEHSSNSGKANDHDQISVPAGVSTVQGM